MGSWGPTFRKIAEADAPVSFLWRRTSRWQRASLLRLIAVAAEEHLPLDPLLEAWASDERGIQRYRVRRVAQLLREGAPLPDALELTPGALRDEDVLAIRFGVQSGTLAASIRESLASLNAPPASRTRSLRGTVVYGAIVALALAVIVTFLQVKIVPSMQMIFDDFNLETPDPLKWSITLASAIAEFWWIGALALLALASSVFSEWPGRVIRHQVFGRHLRALRELRSAEVLDKLSVAAYAGRPVSGALSTLARYHFDPVTRHKLLFVRNEAEQGADVWQSLGTAGLLTPAEIDVINASEHVGNRPWALKQLAGGKKRRTAQFLQRTSDLLLPVMVAALGVFVLFEALSILAPLEALILNLSS